MRAKRSQSEAHTASEKPPRANESAARRAVRATQAILADLDSQTGERVYSDARHPLRRFLRSMILEQIKAQEPPAE